MTNSYTAKRLLHALQLTIQRHEATFGVLEIDVQKRIRPTFMQATPPPGAWARLPPQQGTQATAGGDPHDFKPVPAC